MAGIDTSVGRRGKRATDHEIPLIPFIDCLLCLVAFLLVTAVWSQMARVNADARAPGSVTGEPLPHKKDKQLNVEMKGSTKFRLVWKEGNTVIDAHDVERRPVPTGSNGDIRFPDLAKKIAEEWAVNGAHRAGSDRQFDLAVLRMDDTSPFSDVIAVIDAIHSPKRDFDFAGKKERVSSFYVSLAEN